MDTPQKPKNAKPSELRTDRIVTFFQNASAYMLLIALGALPIIFIPVWYAPFAYTKTIVIVVVLLLGIILYSLSVLRTGQVIWLQNPVLWTLWAVVAAATISGLFAGDLSDTFVGDTLNVHTVFFTVVLAVITTFVAIQSTIRGAVMRFYIALTVSGVLLAAYHLVRLIFGPEALSFGVFTGATATPVGGWNDLGLLFGLTILQSLVALNILPLTKLGRWLFGALVGLSLLMLMVINFFSVWLVLALASMMVLMYSLAKDRFSDASIVESKPVSITSMSLSLVTFILSFSFVIAGSSLGSVISDVTNVSYIEVRPSPVATLDIARSVYTDNMLLGVGPNKFIDAWRTHKDPTINETVFWDTNFTSGSGYIPTQFVTHGLLGTVAWVLFLLALLYTGFRLLLRTNTNDTLWYFISTSSLLAVIYIWGMAMVYTPGVTILILGAAFTGIFIASYMKCFPHTGGIFVVQKNKRAAFVLVAMVMLVIVASASILYYASRHYTSVWLFSEAINNISDGTTIESVEAKIVNVFNIYQNDIYAEQLAQYQLSKINSLLSLAEPTTEQQTQFENAAVTGIDAARQAIALDPTEPRYWALLGAIYSTLALTELEQADDRAREAYQEAARLDPQNPSYALLEARLELELSNLEAAREKINQSLALKSNFTSALSTLAQIEIAEGSVEEAINTTRAIVTIEPNNPARLYQLGTLQLAAEDVAAAITSFERAVQLDTNYANARYLLALAYLEQDNSDAALAQLEVVRSLNPDNAEIQSLIEQIESGEDVTVLDSQPTTDIVDGEAVIGDDDDTVTTNVEPDTDLIAPINPPNTSNSTDESDNENEDVEVDNEDLN